MKPIVFYHDQCLDGFTGAWAAWKKFGRRAEYRGLAHDCARLPSGIGGRTIYFIDYCLPERLMRLARKRAKRCIVIDHHITHRAIAFSCDETVFDIRRSGCVLAWNYFHPGTGVPRLLRTIQDHDLFTLKLKKTEEIITALTLCPRDFLSWDSLVRDFEKSTRRTSLETLGSFLLTYKNVFVERLLEIAQLVTFHGHRAYAVNTHIFYSEAAARIYQTKGVHLGIAWHYADGKIKVSLRSDGSVDCGRLSRIYGGGGHVGASGFFIKHSASFPWKVRMKRPSL